MPAVLFLVLLGLIIALLVGLLLIFRQKRTKAMEVLARKLRLRFYAKGSRQLSPFLANLDFFSRGKYKRVNNLMMGNLPGQGDSISVAIFDYSFTLDLREDSQTFCQSMLLFFVEGMLLPPFCLRPARVLNRLGPPVGFRSIGFPRYPKFSRQYHLTSSQELWVRQVFHPEVIEFLGDENFCAEASGSYLAIYPAGDFIQNEGTIPNRHGHDYAESRFLQPEEIPLFLETGMTFLKLLRQD